MTNLLRYTERLAKALDDVNVRLLAAETRHASQVNALSSIAQQQSEMLNFLVLRSISTAAIDLVRRFQSIMCCWLTVV